jgi:catechol 2,3-dioxygenase-like lactoylglutathione lyase family enzyme
MAKYTGINHLAMATRDMDSTIRFWRDLFGMRLVAGLGRPGYRQYFFEISEHDMIAFFEWPEVFSSETCYVNIILSKCLTIRRSPCLD